MKKYNIAFIAKNISDQIKKLAIGYNNLKFNYCVGDDSLPHVTVCQFYAHDNSVSEIWMSICKKVKKSGLQLSFTSISHTTFNNDVYWISLMPNERELLFNVYKVVTSIVTSIRKDEYEPHMTIFNYKGDRNKCLEQPFDNIELSDEFDLIIGESDSHGQLKKIIGHYNPNKQLSFN